LISRYCFIMGVELTGSPGESSKCKSQSAK
jgi:hypothetical protein